MVYFAVVILLLCLSIRFDINGKTKYRNQWYLVMLVVFVAIAGMRWRVGIDTTRYLFAFYHTRPTLSEFSFADYPIGRDPLWVLLNSIVKSLGGRFFFLQILHASVINILIFKYIKRHSKYIFTCLFFYAITCFFMYNMEIMRGSMSIVVCLYANDYFINKKWIKGYALLIVALLFHAQTIVMFIMPFLLFVRLNKLGLLVLGVAYAIGVISQELIGDYLELLIDNEAIQDKASGYVDSEHYGSEFGLSSILLNFVPTLSYVLGSLWFVKKRGVNTHLLKLEPMVLFFCVFLMVKMNFRVAYRYVEYYNIYVILMYSEALVYLAQSVRFKRVFACCYALLLFSPFFFMKVNYYSKDSVYRRYFPYTSVIDRTEDKARESLFLQMGGRSANLDEY